MQLYLIHAGYYDTQVGDGIFENHANFFIAAESFEDAKLRAKAHPEFAKMHMHVDGMQRIDRIQGWNVQLLPHQGLSSEESETQIIPHHYRQLAKS